MLPSALLHVTWQEREQALDAQLADTRAELSKLKAHQQQLESRNALLEKISHVNKQQVQIAF